MAGFMLTTMFLSMWISNTASTAMMVPIVDAILVELYSVSLSSFVQRGDRGLEIWLMGIHRGTPSLVTPTKSL